MAGRGKVVVTDFIGEPMKDELKILGDIADVVALNAGCEEDLFGRIEDADAIMVYHCIEVTARTIDRLENCKLIVRCGVGFDNVDAVAARKRGIPVANVPDYGTEEVADSAIGLTLSLTRGISYLDNRLRRTPQHEWTHFSVRPLTRLRGQTFGIIGIGRIGTAAALRAKTLGMNVLFYDPYVPDGYDKALGVRRAETLEELLSQSKVVSPHCPLTDETRHIINADTIAQMPGGSYVINTSRGGVVDTTAVLDAVTSSHLAGAAIDVLEQEPPDANDPLIAAWRNPDHPAHDRLIINPHAAFYSEEGQRDMCVKGSENCRRVLLGEAPRNVVN
ncbi:MAG: C-terminal binding protein [Planctomycetaceae bacterium]|nr:C-terminal binding protein [Planctomycetaceae bacterium]MBT6485894.1 C-terminal binding protein [Planctomycetaceae bacterium]MBT6493466.1 C-terminal binding protein [Planctomycetaceae bacterium]